jgi:hypothetical protein
MAGDAAPGGVTVAEKATAGMVTTTPERPLDEAARVATA